MEQTLKNLHDDAQESDRQKQYAVIQGLASGYTALYHIDLDTGDYTNYLAVDAIADTKANFARFTKFTDLLNAFVNSPAVHPDDKHLFSQMRDISFARDLMKDKKRHSITFRRNYGGDYRWTEMLVVKHEPANQPARNVTVGYIDRDEQIRKDLQTQSILRQASEMRSLVESFAQNYEIAYMVNLDEDTYSDIKTADAQKVNTCFSNKSDNLVETIVYPQDRAMMREELDAGTIRKKIAEKASYVIEFRSVSESIPLWSEMTITSIGDESHVAIGFTTKDSEILTRHISDSILKLFEGIYVVDMGRNRMKILKGTGGFKQYEGKVIPQRETMQFFASNLTGEDQIFFRDVYGDPQKVVEVLSRDSDIEYIYRSPNYGGGYIWMKSEVHTLTWDENGLPQTAMVGISKIDSQQRERMQLNARIAEQKELLEKQQEQLKDALAMAQSASRAKTTFLNNMSHDIRTPMNAIIGFTELASRHIDEKEKVQDYLAKIGKSSEHLLSLINDVLDMSRIESGKISLDEKSENLLEMIKALQDMIHSDIEAKNLDFLVDTTEVIDEEIICDKLRLNQVLLNVLTNAIKYTPAGGTVSMRIAEKPAGDNGYANYEFRIKDNGMGMTEDFIKTIYDPFTRVKSSTISGIQGTGLGMAITKNIVDMMGGDIEITSILQQGTEVVISLNFKTANGSCRPVMDSAPEEDCSVSLEGSRILLVEDNELNREIATTILEESGCTVVQAEDGDIAVEMMKQAREGDYDLVLMDIQMPTIDGYQATRLIRALGTEISRIPILAMTANAFEEDRQLAIEAGMNEHIAKPIDVEHLKKMMKKYI